MQMQKHWEDEASFSDLIISYLLSSRSVRIQKKVLYELVQKRRILNKQVFNNNLYRLKQKGILNFDSKKDIFVNKNTLNQYMLFSKIEVVPKGDTKVMVLFDIPEKKRKIRNWLRTQLKMWNFEMIQQSVWLGGGSLPKEFSTRLHDLGVGECVKIFPIRKIKN